MSVYLGRLAWFAVVLASIASAIRMPPLGLDFEDILSGAEALEPPHKSTYDPSRLPIVLVPGLLGSRLLATSSSSYSTPYWWCNFGQGETWTIWVETENFYPYMVDCTFYNMMLQNMDDLMVNRPGIDIYPDGKPGDVYNTVVWGPKNESDYGLIVKNLTSNGYEVGRNLFGMYYRWRFGPREWKLPGHDWDQLKSVIEDASAANDNKPVILFSISMGGPYLNKFLQAHVTQEWKDRYIRAWVSTSGVFGGSSSALLETTSGNNWGVSYIPPSMFRDLSRSWPSVYFLMPPPAIWGDEVYVSAKGRNFSAEYFTEMMDAMGAVGPNVVPLEYIQEMLNDDYVLDGPGVEVYCYYGTEVPTPFTLSFDVTPGQMGNVPPEVTMTGGDGTVTYKGLALCKNWRENANKTVHAFEYPGANHVAFLSNTTLTYELAMLMASLE